MIFIESVLVNNKLFTEVCFFYYLNAFLFHYWHSHKHLYVVLVINIDVLINSRLSIRISELNNVFCSNCRHLFHRLFLIIVQSFKL